MKYYTPEQPEPQTASMGTFRPIRMEQDVVVGRVSKDLYASPASGLRELLANEIRAAATAKDAGADPRIEVTVTPHMVRVWGINSLGMRRDIFDAIYMVLGRSSNFDRTVPGQFGLGRAAYTTISDHILIETSHRNGDCYAVLGVEGRGYQTGLPQPDMPYGTRVTMVPGDVDVDSMADMARKIAGRADIPVTLVTGNRAETIPHAPLADDRHPVERDLGDVVFAAGRPEFVHSKNVTAYLCGMPIRFTYRGRHDADFVLDVRDEGKYPPTPDRERMTERAEVEISSRIDESLDRWLETLPRDFCALADHPGRGLACSIDAAICGGLFQKYVRVYQSWGYREQLGRVVGVPMLNCRMFSRARIDAVRERFPNAAFVAGVPELPDIVDFMKRHGIKTKAGTAGVVLHTVAGVVRVNPDSPPARYDTIYRVPRGTDLARCRHRLDAHVALTIHDVSGAVDLRDVANRPHVTRFLTSMGVMTGAQILVTGLETYRTARPSLAECWGSGPYEEPSIMVCECPEYVLLSYLAPRIHHAIRDWGGAAHHVIETYVRLQSPALKRVLLEWHGGRDPPMCDEFMVLDGQAPLPHDAGCRCPECCGG